ncbi:protein YIPF6-like [Symsagittifera roscoffensis]|uniref:protein YIPF6-like n=1 Tax=Symsagittifera roscoffensis TaxID=84072 RepID=UPI00307B6B5F
MSGEPNIEVSLDLNEEDSVSGVPIHGQMDGGGAGVSVSYGYGDTNRDPKNANTMSSYSNQSSAHFSTLDESIVDTVLRDAKRVGHKFLAALVPRQDKMLLREWDLWGPLFLYVCLALLLPNNGSKDSSHEDGSEFVTVFVLVSVGSIVVTANTQLLGGSISFFQSLCVLGYCVLPLFFSLAACRVVMLLTSEGVGILSWSFLIRLIFVIGAFSWSIYASTVFMADCRPPNKKGLISYPICLYYFVLGWLVLFSTQQ